MDWFVGTVTLYEEGEARIEHTVLCARSFVEAMKKMVAFYGDDTEDIRLEVVAAKYPVLPISEDLYTEIKAYCEEHTI